MAANRKGHGHSINIPSASAAIVSGITCVQNNFFGVAKGSAAISTSFELAIEGRYNIPVPASTVIGDFLYVPSSAGGVLLTTSADTTAALTRTSSNANAPVCKAMTSRDANGYADVVILPPGATRGATQV